MKKYLFFLVAVVAMAFTSCSKDTTYQVSNKTDHTLYDMVAFEHRDADRVDQKNIGNLGVGTNSEILTADKQAEKVKLAFRFSSDGNLYYTVQYFYLESKNNKVITLNNDTYVSTNPNAKDGVMVGKLK